MQFSLYSELQELYFKGNSEAVKGKKVIDEYFANSDGSGLAKLLRYHGDKAISNKETWKRDYVDFYIQYFSILSIAVIMGGINRDEFLNLRPQITYYLGDTAIRPYYTRYYPLLLPEILFWSALEREPFVINETGELLKNSFPVFHHLNQQIANDDVYQFLWFLDGGSSGRYDLDNLIEVLGDLEQYQKVMKYTSDNPLRQSLNGFLDFLFFLEDFSAFLGRLESSVQKSAYWHFHGYWFKKIEENLKRTISRFFSGLTNLAGTTMLKKDEKVESLISNLNKGEKQYLKLYENLLSDKYRLPLQKKFDTWLSRNEDFRLIWKNGLNLKSIKKVN
jgi:hypothetical protein